MAQLPNMTAEMSVAPWANAAVRTTTRAPSRQRRGDEAVRSGAAMSFRRKRRDITAYYEWGTARKALLERGTRMLSEDERHEIIFSSELERITGRSWHVIKIALMQVLLTLATASSAPRNVRVSGRTFVATATGSEIVLAGPNVVVKGPPYLPAVAGTTHCHDVVDAACSTSGTCTSCETFNAADVALIKSQGRNMIRLGVVWAGAQPRDEDALDADFERRLHAILNLTDAAGLHVMLDNHGDMTASAACGNGMPMWFSQKAAPQLIGQPLKTGLPFSLVPGLRISSLIPLASPCGANASTWAEHAGDPNYNLLNDCCLSINSGNPGPTGWTTIAQANMNYMITEGPGRDAFVRYWSLLAIAVAQHPSAFAAELSNEPMTMNRRDWYDTSKACALAINAIVPDMAVAFTDTGESSFIPKWATALEDLLPLPYLAPSAATVAWLKSSTTAFYAFHGYQGVQYIKDAVGTGTEWSMPTFATEFGSCEFWDACAAQNISHSYWHYSSYCTTGPAFGNRTVPTDTFGGCILGWGGGDEAKCMAP